MIPLTQWCGSDLRRAVVPGVAALVCVANCAADTGLNALSSPSIRAQQPLTGPAASIGATDKPLVGHGDVPEKVKLSPEIMVMHPRRPHIPILGDPLVDIDHFPPGFPEIKDTPDFTGRSWSGSTGADSGDHSAVPAPGSTIVLTLASLGLLFPRRRRP